MRKTISRRHYLRRLARRAALLPALAAFPGIAFAQSDLGSPQRIRELQATLKIKDGQAGPWSDYVAALKAYRAAVRDEREAEIQLMGGAQAIEGDDDAVLRERQGERRAAKAALKSTYEALHGALDPAQQQIADATLTAGECGR